MGRTSDYLIKHIKGDPGTLHLSAAPGGSRKLSLRSGVRAGTTYHATINIGNTSSWLDYAAILKATRTGSSKAWDVRYRLKGQDITQDVLGPGFKFYQSNRINPATTTPVELTITRTSFRGPSALQLKTELRPHQGQPAMDTVLVTTGGVTSVGYKIMPAPTVSLVASSIKIKLPVIRLRR